MVRLKRSFLVLILLVGLAPSVFAFQSFVVGKIQLIGLQRIRSSTVLSYMPIHVGQKITSSDAQAIISSLYDTSFFHSIELKRRGRTLIVDVKERPTIAVLHIVGNKAIKTKKLTPALNQLGITTGHVYDSASVTTIVDALREQYYNMGHYAVRITVDVKSETQNRVALFIHIYEGPVAKILGIRVVGNEHFPSAELISLFHSTTPGFLTFLSHGDDYSEQKLSADLQGLAEFYMDRGYLHFSIISKQVSISPDHDGIYIVIHINEGPLYRFSHIELQGNPIGKKQQILKLIDIKPGQLFSRQKLVDINSGISEFCADRGYAFPQVIPDMQVNDSTHEVAVTYKVIPGKVYYVRYINIMGNNFTKQRVIRQQLRQFEASRFSLNRVNESKRNLWNLGYLNNIQTQIQKVPDTNNQLDMNVHVNEINSGRASIQGGYSDVEGFLYGASISEPNFLGTGKYVSIGFTRSALSNMYNFSYNNPYYKSWGVGRGFSLYYSQMKPSDTVNLVSYDMDGYGGSINYSFPLTEYTTFGLSVGFDHSKILNVASDTPEITDFIDRYGNEFDQPNLSLSLMYSDLDRILFPTTGLSLSLSTGWGFPAFKDSLAYYTVSGISTYYHPLGKGFIVRLHSTLGYGDGYGSYKTLPFFKNFFAGGLDSMPGFQGNTLGPKDSSGDGMGGNIEVIGGVDLIVPNHISDNLRTAISLTAGNIYQDKIDTNLKWSLGVILSWRIPILGRPIQFGLSKPLNATSKDETQAFQFSMGASL